MELIVDGRQPRCCNAGLRRPIPSHGIKLPQADHGRHFENSNRSALSTELVPL